MQATDIKDRESFIKYRRSWKAVYAFITEEIRQAKRAQTGLVRRPNSHSFPKDLAKLQVDASVLRKRARRLMLDLSEAKAKRPLSN